VSEEGKNGEGGEKREEGKGKKGKAPREEKKQGESTPKTNLQNPEGGTRFPFPVQHGQNRLEVLVQKGYRPRIKTVDGINYLTMRKRDSEYSLGQYSPERANLLLEKFPQLNTDPSQNTTEGSIPTVAGKFPHLDIDGTVGDTDGENMGNSTLRKQSSKFLSVPPLKRDALFPKEYQPSLKIIRFFEAYKNNGGTADFSAFINDLVLVHLTECHKFDLDIHYK
jgi:hypothetical protein